MDRLIIPLFWAIVAAVAACAFVSSCAESCHTEYRLSDGVTCRFYTPKYALFSKCSDGANHMRVDNVRVSQVCKVSEIP